MLKNTQHIYFDLDHTLWDFETNSELTLNEIFIKFELAELLHTTIDTFITTYKKVNDLLWKNYREHKITKKELRVKRFFDTLLTFHYSSPLLAQQIADYYITHSPYKKQLMPGALDVLNYLNNKYQLHIISNGFKEVQHIKLKESGIKDFFTEIILSEEVGVNKPHPEIFHYLLKQTNCTPDKAVVIGDNIEADIKGAAGVGIPQILYNPKQIRHNFKPTFEITHLQELTAIL